MGNFFGSDREMKIWVEKYRPKVLEDYIGNDHIKAKVGRYLEENDIPHLLFHSASPGTGKTTIAKIIVNNIDCDYMYINASDENNVETVRNKIKHFASSVALNNIKVVILDEADYLTPNAQAILRNLMEAFSTTTRFILTCNYVEKLIDPVVSRTQSFKVIPPKKSDVAKTLVGILKKESVEFDKEPVALLVNQYYPDIRKVVNTAQQNTIDDKLTIQKDSFVESSFEMKLLELLKDEKLNSNKLFTEIRQLTANSSVTSFTEVYRFLFDEVDEYAKGNVAQVMLQLAESQYQDALVVDKEITFAACMINVIGIIR